MKLFRWTLLLAMAVLLSACGGNTVPTLTMTLNATPAQVASGGTTALEATFEGDASAVASVEFSVQGGAALPTDTTAADGFKATSAAVTGPTTFVAVAKDAGGAELTRDDVAVTVTTAPAQPNAEDKAVTTLAGVRVVSGSPTSTPALTGLAVLTSNLVATNGTARLKGTATGGTAVVNPDGSFTFTPAVGATSGSFDYEVVSGALIDTAKVTVTIKALPADVAIVKTPDELTTATATGSTIKTIIVDGTVVCAADPCAGLEAGQKLVGKGVVDGVTLVGTAKLDMTRPGDESTPPEDNNFTVITLAKGATVEGLEISGRDVYTAIRGVDLDFVGSTDADLVTIKNVKIVGPTSNTPIGFTLSAGQTDSTYNMLIDGLTVENANRTIGFPAFKKLELKNSTFNLNVPSGNGIFFQSEGTSEVILDKVTVNSSIATGALSAINLTQADGDEVMTITVKDTAVTFTNDSDAATPFDLATAVAFNVTYGALVSAPAPAPADGRINILTAASTGNSTNATSGDALKYEVTDSTNNVAQAEDVVKGHIQGTPATVFETRP